MSLPALGTPIDQLCVNTLRFLALDGVQQANSGHPGLPMEAAPLGYVLWTRFLRHNPGNPSWAGRDRFILSAGHGSMLLYGLLHLTGYDLPLDELRNFRQWGSKTPGHPEFGHTPGVETTTGPLGQGFATGVGMAIAQRHLAARFNREGFPIADWSIYAFVSDGDMMEGISSEAASLAGHLKLGQLIYVYLDNHITIEGDTGLAFGEDVGKRFEAYGWSVRKVETFPSAARREAEVLPAFAQALAEARAQTERPNLIIVRTHIGYGSPHEDRSSAHGSPMKAEEARAAKENLGWPTEPTFHIPSEALDVWRQTVPRGAQAESDWRKLFSAYAAAHPDLAREWDEWHSGKLPEDWRKAVPVFTESAMATRSASGKVLNALAARLPQLIGGSADLAPSNETNLKGMGDFQVDPAGRNLHFGIREHAMGAILNGMALDRALIPFCGTFLVFADYMRPAIRLASLMKLGVVYVFTHDSIGVGEDGPTHQPIEHLASLRIIPGLVTLRPADANETAVAWEVALERRDGPTALILTRQKLPVLAEAAASAPLGLRRGGYVLSDALSPRAVLVATGSEVALAMQAQVTLKERGIPVRVVSLPSWELFAAQSQDYRDEVLPPGLPKLAIEAASSFGWHRWVGEKRRVLGLDHFGASAPGDVLFREFGFTVENVVAMVEGMAGSR